MQAVLNFSKEEKPKVKAFLSQFPVLPLSSGFEELRATVDSSVAILYSSGKLLIQGNSSEAVKEKILKEIGIADELFLGIDEVGRGENFGPLVVAGVLGKRNSLRELRDSKKTGNISQKKKIVLENCIATFVVSVSAQKIDELRGAGKNLNQIEAEIIDSIVLCAQKTGLTFKILVDGNPLPVSEKEINFLPKADDLNPVVGAASVLAKATREESADNTIRKSWNTKK